MTRREQEPKQPFRDGEQVTYVRDDGRRGIGTVVSYDRNTGQLTINTKNSGLVVRYWAGVSR